MRYFLFSVLAVASSAQAQDFTSTSQFSGSVSSLEVHKAQAGSIISNAQDSAKAVGRVDFLGPAGRQASAQLEAQIARKAVLTAAARTLAAATGYGAAAIAAWEIYEHFRIKGDAANGGGGLVHDPGVPQEQVALNVFCSNFGCDVDPHVAGKQMAGAVQAQSAGTAIIEASVVSVKYPDPNPNYSTTWDYRYDCQGSPGGSLNCVGQASGSIIYKPNEPVTRCPAQIDPLDPSKSIPAGSPLGADGKCPTGRYTVGKTAQEAADMVAAAAMAQNIDLAKLFRESIGFNLGDIPPETPKKVTAVTPATVKGQTTTTVHPNGTSTEVTTEHEPAPIAGFQTSRSHLVPWWMKTTTTTKDAAGNPTGTTSTTVKPEVTPGTDPAPGGGDPADPCVSDPGRLGCIGLGTIPPEPELPTRIISMSAEPDSGWGSFNATCPAPRSIALSGGSMTLDNTVLCDWLSMARFLVIGFASLAGIRIILGGVST